MIANKWQTVEDKTVVVYVATESPAVRLRASAIFFFPSLVVLLALAWLGTIAFGTALSFILLAVIAIVANYWLCLWDRPGFSFPHQIRLERRISDGTMFLSQRSVLLGLRTFEGRSRSGFTVRLDTVENAELSADELSLSTPEGEFVVPLGVWPNEAGIPLGAGRGVAGRCEGETGRNRMGHLQNARSRQLRYQMLEPIVIVGLACAWTFLFH